MNKYTGYEWILIDVCSHMGFDKITFEERIQWTKDNMSNLESLIDMAEKKPLYIKAIMAIRKAQAHKPTGHLVGVDAACSGIQIMSALTGCNAGATATGLVDPTRVADAYTQTTQTMSRILGSGVDVSRTDAKYALMTSFYGSKARPKEIFGEDSPELAAFYKAAKEVAPGAWELLQTLLASWNPQALYHAWKMPDGYDVKVNVMVKKELRIEVDELDHATFSYEYYENEPTKTGLSNVANVTHSVDAYVLRCMHRLCNYDDISVNKAHYLLNYEVNKRANNLQYAIHPFDEQIADEFVYYVAQYNRSNMVDITILPYINERSVLELSTEHAIKLYNITKKLLTRKPFELVTIHDEFKCHPNYVDHMRYHYKEILADIADSNLLDDLLSQLYGKQGTFPKLSSNLGDLIRKSEYALC